MQGVALARSIFQELVLRQEALQNADRLLGLAPGPTGIRQAVRHGGALWPEQSAVRVVQQPTGQGFNVLPGVRGGGLVPALLGRGAPLRPGFQLHRRGQRAAPAAVVADLVQARGRLPLVAQHQVVFRHLEQQPTSALGVPQLDKQSPVLASGLNRLVGAAQADVNRQQTLVRLTTDFPVRGDGSETKQTFRFRQIASDVPLLGSIQDFCRCLIRAGGTRQAPAEQGGTDESQARCSEQGAWHRRLILSGINQYSL